MSKDESELIRQAKKGRPAAFAEIYDRHQPAIYRYIFYRVGDVEIAEDLTAEVFVRLVEKIGHFTYRGRPLLAWLYTIARNLITDHYRRAGRTATMPEDEQLVCEKKLPEEYAQRALTRQWLAAAIANLTPDQRDVILMKFVADLDNATVARVLHKSVGAVKALQHRALTTLRRILEQDEEAL
ncbi:MAG: sigma-70 family RNA polymerase sigma factor [Anaerolineae bacterium]|nr:sigma-70 family RNA polymerase sigma factor [Anaerolineae bacterium]